MIKKNKQKRWIAFNIFQEEAGDTFSRVFAVDAEGPYRAAEAIEEQKAVDYAMVLTPTKAKALADRILSALAKKKADRVKEDDE